MPGTNAGTGQPLTLKCYHCRKSIPWRQSYTVELEATGRTKPTTRRGIRQTNRKIEYRCLKCGHVGWTQHIDAERLLASV